MCYLCLFHKGYATECSDITVAIGSAVYVCEHMCHMCLFHIGYTAAVCSMISVWPWVVLCMCVSIIYVSHVSIPYRLYSSCV